MQAKSMAAAPAAASSKRKRRPRSKRAQLAALPDPVHEAAKAAAADKRARRKLAAATAAGAPLTDRTGRARSPITLPEYRRGRAPANKGRRFPAEILTPG